MSKTNKWYGWIPDLPDNRDLFFRASKAIPLPDRVDLRETSLFADIYDQGALGSCTANAIASGFTYALNKQIGPSLEAQGLPNFKPSRLFIYYNERVMIGTVASDSGAMIRDGIKSLVKQGACAEKLWPYSDGPTKFKRKPTVKCYSEAKNHQLLKYQRCLSPLAIQQALAVGYPVVSGFTVYESFEGEQVAKSGEVPLPGEDEDVLGGHAILIVGYDKTKNYFIVRNSWGEDWGDKGHCYMPFDLDFEDSWMMSLVEQE